MTTKKLRGTVRIIQGLALNEDSECLFDFFEAGVFLKSLGDGDGALGGLVVF